MSTRVAIPLILLIALALNLASSFAHQYFIAAVIMLIALITCLVLLFKQRTR